MSYADRVNEHHGERPVIGIQLVIDATTYRWSDHDLEDTGTPAFWDGRLLSAGRLDREISGPTPGGGDLQIRVANTDGALDDLLSDWGTSGNNILEGKVTVIRAFDGHSAATEARTQGTLEYARLVGIDEDRVVTIDLVGVATLLFGYVKLPTVGQVMDALEVVDGSLWDQSPASDSADGFHEVVPGARDMKIPAAFGRFQMHRGRFDGVLSSPVASHTGTVDGVTARKFPIYMVAVSYGAFAPYPMRFAESTEDGGVPEGGGRLTEVTTGIGAYHGVSVDVTVDGQTIAVLVFRITQRTPPLMFGVNNKILGTELRNPNPAELIEALARFGDAGSWAADADSASFDDVAIRFSRVATRLLVASSVPAVKAIADVARACYFDLYVTAGGKLKAFTLQPLGGASPDYTAEVDLTEEFDLLAGGSRPYFTEPGERHGMINLVEVQYQQNVSEYVDVPGDVLSLSIPRYGPSFYEQENTVSSDRHGGRIGKVVIGDPRIIPDIHSAKRLAERVLALNPDPRVILEGMASIKGTQLELGDLVLVGHTLVPGWSGPAKPRVCVVDAIVDDLERHTARLRLIDYDDYFNLKAGYYSARSSWDVEVGGVGFDVDVVNSSLVLQFNGGAVDLTALLAGDLFRIDTSLNRFMKPIASIDTGAGTVTLEAGGAAGHEDGPLSSTFVNESGATAWGIYRSQKNRATAGGNYAVQAAKYACFGADDDGLFRDDATAAYDYQ